MFDSYSDGFCPQCLLTNQQEAMVLNRMDLWECPICHLQVAGGHGIALIQRERGEGLFRHTKVVATDHMVGVLLQKQSASDPFAGGGAFRDKEELRFFLAEEVK